MTMTEKLRIHREIEEENRRHEQEWREAISQAAGDAQEKKA